MAAYEVDDTEAIESQANVSGNEGATVVGAAVFSYLPHPVYDALVDGIPGVEKVNSINAAHKLPPVDLA
jgi:hypothetical protein